MATLRKITIEGYKSIKQMTLEVRPLNVLIGANGAGKSNCLSLFRLLSDVAGERLRTFVGASGGASSLLFYGAKTTPYLQATLEFEAEESVLGKSVEFVYLYCLRLLHSADDTFTIAEERIEAHNKAHPENRQADVLDAGHPETALHFLARDGHRCARAVVDFLSNCRVFHFHDTSPESRIRQTADLDDNLALHSDGGNLAAMLYRFRGAADEGERVAYFRIVETFRQLAPWFGEFVLEPDPRNPEKIRLRWRDKGSEVVFGPHVLPDGALRAIALIALLLQPREMLPRLIVIDEPELGLHPFAINALAGLVAAAACHCQVILATQSVSLLEQFDPEDVVVVEREHGASTLKRLQSDDLKEWLEDYSLGELWQKNVIGGGPV